MGTITKDDDMKIAIGSDHGGFELKSALILFLKEKGHDVEDFGTCSRESCDYPLMGYDAAKAVATKRCAMGVLICKSGIGMTMVANKVPGVRAALMTDEDAARSSREHNDANLATFSASKMDADEAKRLLEIWLGTEFVGGRHQRRIDQIADIEKKRTVK